jgi:hypothetical protein
MGWVVIGQCYAPPNLPPRKRPSIHRTDHLIHHMGGWVGPRASLDRSAKYRLTVIRFPGYLACSEFKCNATWKLSGLRGGGCSYARFLLGLCLCLCFGEKYCLHVLGEWFWVDAEVMRRKIMAVIYGIA